MEAAWRASQLRPSTCRLRRRASRPRLASPHLPLCPPTGVQRGSRRRPRQPTDGLRGRVGFHHRPLLPHPRYGNPLQGTRRGRTLIATTVSHCGALRPADRSAAALADAPAAAPATSAPGAAWLPSGSASAAAPGSAWPPPGSASAAASGRASAAALATAASSFAPAHTLYCLDDGEDNDSQTSEGALPRPADPTAGPGPRGRRHHQAARTPVARARKPLASKPRTLASRARPTSPAPRDSGARPRCRPRTTAARASRSGALTAVPEPVPERVS